MFFPFQAKKCVERLPQMWLIVTLKKSHFAFAVSDPRRVKASGRGLQPKGVRVKDSADFRVNTEGAGEGEVDVKVIGSGE